MMRRYLMAAATAAIALVAGCDDGDRFTQTRSADIYTDPAYQAIGSDLVASLVFDRVPEGRTSRQTIRVGHDGEAPLVISQIYLEGAPDCDRTTAGITPDQPFPDAREQTCQWAIDERPELPLTLDEGAFRDVRIAYKALNPANPQPGTLLIQSNALDKPVIRVELDVIAARPSIVAFPTTLSFPGGVDGQDAIQVRNSGNGILTLSDIRLRRLNDAPRDPQTMEPLVEWVIDPDRELPQQLQDGQALQVLVRYTPKDEGPDNAELTFVSDDPANPNVTVFLTSAPVSSTLVVQPNPLVFGAPQGPGSPITRNLSLTNTGLRTLFINGMEIEQDVDAFSFEGQDSFQIVPGQSRQLAITFNPRSAEGSDGVLVVRTDADNIVGGQLVVPLVRSAAEIAALDISPVSVQLDEVARGGTEATTITLSNPGGQPLEVTRIAMTGEGDAPLTPSDPEFTIIRGGMPVTLPPGGMHTVEVSFTRGDDDNNLHLGILVIESGAATSPDVVRFTSRPPPQ
ncbi:MAG: choice-of-anchor D domain-containing protein [Myxococcales bacterium]|nr:choice-of-anchor D domain-containing protein [Myxococcales bacterium]